MRNSGFRVLLEKNAVKFTLHGVPNRPGMAAEIFDHLSRAGINVELVVQSAVSGSRADISLALQKSDTRQAQEQLQRMRNAQQAENISQDENVALITLEKEELSKTSGAAARMFRTLANLETNIDLISTSLSSITCLIAEDRAEEAHRALVAEFGA